MDSSNLAIVYGFAACIIIVVSAAGFKIYWWLEDRRYNKAKKALNEQLRRVRRECQQFLKEEIMEKENPMTKEEMKAQIKQELDIDTAIAVVETIVEVVDENPELVEGISNLIAKYAELFGPAVKAFAKTQIEVREEAFNRFKELGLSDDQAIKLVCGR
jgi:hypothetical protein